MRSKVAVATVQGKAYFLVVNELKRRNIPFINLVPGDAIPIEIKVVITTEKEKHQVNHEKVLVYNPETDPEVMGSEVVRILQGKEAYETVVIGVDPGQVFGVAVIADEGLIDTENCLSVKEVGDKIERVLRIVDFSSTAVTVKIGSGVPIYKELLEALDEVLPKEVSLEIIGEAGTNVYACEMKNRRGVRHIVSAMRIAGRPGYVYERKRKQSFE